MVTQDLLRTALRARVDRVGHEPDSDENELTAVVVLRGFEPVTFARSALAFVWNLAPSVGEKWLRCFTRTVFLTGKPANLESRFHFGHVTDDRSIGWCGPAPAKSTLGLRRLLKLYRPGGTLRVTGDFELRVPGEVGGTARLIHVATAGLSISDYLIHLNHTLAEGVLTGLITAGDRLMIRHVTDLDDAVVATAAALRVHHAQGDPELLRAYTSLSEPVEANWSVDRY